MKKSVATLRSRKARVIVRLLQALVGAAAIAGITSYANWLVSIDPFSRYRPAAKKDPGSEVGLELTEVSFAIYDGKSKVGTCMADKIEVSRDRQTIQFHTIRKGTVNVKEGELTFQAPNASYSQRGQVLSVLKGAKIQGKDMAIQVDGFSFYRRMNRLNTVGKITGKLMGGAVEASNLAYYTEDNSMTLGPVKWVGNPKGIAGELPGLQTTTPWTIKAAKMKMVGNKAVYTDGFATDGEVIVRAKTIDHDRKTDVVVAKGDVKYFSAKANLVCEVATIYRKEKRAVLTGNVTMLVKPTDQEKLEEAEIPPFRPIVPESIAQGRPSAPPPAESNVRRNNTARKYPTQVWAERIEYFYQKGSRKANISGSPQARQDLPGGEWRHVWTNTAFYDGEAEKLRLISSNGKKDTRVKNSKGDDLIATWFLVNTKENQEDEWEAEGVEGTIVSDDDETNPPPPGGNAPPLRGSIGG